MAGQIEKGSAPSLNPAYGQVGADPPFFTTDSDQFRFALEARVIA